jgi:hypothetical protein
MILAQLLTLLLAAAATTLAQTVYDQYHNTTSLTGTWSSGSQHVVTGTGFANPANTSFTYPTTAGVSYSFTDDGFYEIARYRFNSNGSEPTCITGVIGWVHGTYTLNGNGSIVATPLGDGYQQIQDPCAAVSNFIENYNDTELYQSWQIFTDPVTGYKLHLFAFDGSPVAPQFQVSPTPNMLPTVLLRNVSQPETTTTQAGLTKQQTLMVSAAQRGHAGLPGGRIALGILVGLGLGLLSVGLP